MFNELIIHENREKTHAKGKIVALKSRKNCRGAVVHPQEEREIYLIYQMLIRMLKGTSGCVGSFEYILRCLKINPETNVYHETC